MKREADDRIARVRVTRLSDGSCVYDVTMADSTQLERTITLGCVSKAAALDICAALNAGTSFVETEVPG
jgi:hypothetical protein